MPKPLGRLVPLDPRDCWSDEARDFTPWLAQPENIRLLGETLDLDLELVAQERNVGPFRADILCKETTDNHWVLIENQLERTDHGHLGQPITYAAGLEAVTIVWIARRFTEEHKSALDWLNRVTNDSINFFGLEVELWRINDSVPAPKFNLISKPDDWARTVKQSAAGSAGITETKKLQLDFWSAFRKYMEENGSHIRCQKPLPQQWTNISIGRSNFHLVAYLRSTQKKAAVYLALTGPNAKENFRLLESQKSTIIKELGHDVEWRELPEKKESQVSISIDCDLANRSEWPMTQQWLKETVERFHRVFGARVKSLELTSA